MKKAIRDQWDNIIIGWIVNRKGIRFASSFTILCLFFSWVLKTPQIQAQLINNNPPELQGIGVDEHLGTAVPQELDFRNELGNRVSIGDLLNSERPVVLTLAYYECPMLCTLVLNGLCKAIKAIPLVPGKDYTLLTISIDPDEGCEFARAKRNRYLESLGSGNDTSVWNFWVGTEKNIRQLADSLGFRYIYDSKQDEYGHSAVVFVLTKKGVISRYLYGIDIAPKDLRLALIEAAEGKIGNVFDRVLLFCYHYDPTGKKYALMATNVMRLGGLTTIVALGVFLGLMWLKER